MRNRSYFRSIFQWKYFQSEMYIIFFDMTYLQAKLQTFIKKNYGFYRKK